MALTKISNHIGVEIRYAPHSKYGKVNVYNKSAIDKLESMVKSGNALTKFRKDRKSGHQQLRLLK